MLRLFLLTMVMTACALLAFFYVNRPERRLTPAELKPVGDSLFVTAQLQPTNMDYLRSCAIRTVVDFRPDGEASDQPSSAEIMRAAHGAGINFHYIPVAHGPIPADAVRELNDVLSSTSAGRVVLYCRTGNRAARTYALVEASRPGGPDVDNILAMVRRAGFSADDLRDQINQRIADRKGQSTANSP